MPHGWPETSWQWRHAIPMFAEAGYRGEGFDLYRAFEQDADDTRAAIESSGKLKMPCLRLYGQMSLFRAVTKEMGWEVAEDVSVESVAESGHWIAEENPEALVEIVVRFDPEGALTIAEL